MRAHFLLSADLLLDSHGAGLTTVVWLTLTMKFFTNNGIIPYHYISLHHRFDLKRELVYCHVDTIIIFNVHLKLWPNLRSILVYWIFDFHSVMCYNINILIVNFTNILPCVENKVWFAKVFSAKVFFVDSPKFYTANISRYMVLEAKKMLYFQCKSHASTTNYSQVIT